MGYFVTPRVRADTIPVDYVLLPQRTGLEPDAFFRNAFNPTTFLGQNTASNAGVQATQHIGIHRKPPCTRDPGPFPDDGVIVSLADTECLANGFDPGLPLATKCTEAVCDPTSLWRTVRFRHTLTNHAPFAQAGGSIGISFKPMNPSQLFCIDLQGLPYEHVLDFDGRVTGYAGAGADETFLITYSYAGVPVGDDTVIFDTALSYCTNDPTDSFNVTARVNSNHCSSVISDWTRCVPDTDYRECYHEAEVEPLSLSCPEPVVTPAPTPVPPTPVPGGLAASPFALDPIVECYSRFCVSIRDFSALGCVNTTTAVCMVPQADRGFQEMGMRIRNKNTTAPSDPFILDVVFRRGVVEPPACGHFAVFYRLVVRNSTSALPGFGGAEFRFEIEDESVVKGRVSHPGLPPAGQLELSFYAMECISSGPGNLDYDFEGRLQSVSCFVESECSLAVSVEDESFSNPGCHMAPDCPHLNRTRIVDENGAYEGEVDPAQVRGAFLAVFWIVVVLICGVALICLCCVILRERGYDEEAIKGSARSSVRGQRKPPIIKQGVRNRYAQRGGKDMH